jgi:electron transport complex protein RnfC
VDRDFAGGIYLMPLGDKPPADSIATTSYNGECYLPLSVGSGEIMEVLAKKGQQVSKGELLAKGDGCYLYAPNSGMVGGKISVWAHGKPEQPALTLLPAKNNLGHYKNTLSSVFPAVTTKPNQKEAVWQLIEKAGIIVPDRQEPLAIQMKRLAESTAPAVVANATPLEPSLNGPLAILHLYPERVFAGLAILKTWLGAEQAIMAYPYHFEGDLTSARDWEVRCVPVSEKYPQGRSGSVLRTLIKQGILPKTSLKKQASIVFDVQLLTQVERAVLAEQVVTDRIITISGDGVTRPSHFMVPLGMPLKELLTWAGMYEDARCVVEGSSMAGTAVDVEHTVIAQTSQAFTVLHRLKHHRAYSCIRCGWCIDDCPVEIDPVHLLQLAESGQYQLAGEIGAESCVECGICSYICPSHLRIMEHIRMIKRKLHPRCEFALFPEDH